MPFYPFFTLWRRLRRLAALGLLLPGAGCANHQYFQADARVGPGSAQPLPAGADSVLATAGRQYNRHGRLYHFFFGRHYRQAWATPVRAPVLRLPTAAPGGLVAGKAGGGYQSISMTLLGRQQREYSLRALDKEPVKTLPTGLRETFVLNVVRDATSAALPYGALTVPPLAAAAGVPHGRPRLVYVRPDEAGLGELSARFGGKLALLEEKYEVPASATPDLAGADDFRGSEAMLRDVYARPGAYIDQPAFLRARLLDLLLGDWDRHEGQWEWAAFREPRGRVRYVGIPKDRDQVYFRFADGLVPWLAARRYVAPKFQTFRDHFDNVAGLVEQARFIDQRALAALTRADFRRAARELQNRLPDSVVDRAMRRLPPPIYALEGPRLAAGFKGRRAALPAAADDFYRALARRPAVGGTARPERFVVHRYADSTTVAVYSAAAAADSLHFYRTYYRRETQRLRLHGLGGDDVFEVLTAAAARPMPLEVFGGEGQDRLRPQGSTRRLKLYDAPPDLAAPGAPRPSPPGKKPRPYDRFADK